MTDRPTREKSKTERERTSDAAPVESVVGGSQWSPLAAAALVGGAVAATAGAYLGTRAIARRNARKDGRPVNAVMATAITACDLAHKQPADPDAAPESGPTPHDD